MSDRVQPVESIQWRSWDASAFQEAKRVNRPIFLSISATWCHWCHVMDAESFAHPEVIRQLNKAFIPIRVDSDRRPDVHHRYNMGGWPTVVILDPTGAPLAGDTYMPTGQLLQMLSSALERADTSTAETDGISTDVASRGLQGPIGRVAGTPLPSPTLSADMVEIVLGYLDRVYDHEYGGFGGPPKFPQPWALELLLQTYEKSGDNKYLRMVTHTLDGMRDAEIYDHDGDGFFRYATRGDWDHPHYEKLLDVNARLLSVYAAAGRVTGSDPYRETAEGVLVYLDDVLAVPDAPWFCGSQSADREYYELPDEIRSQAEPPPLDRTLYIDRNAIAVSALWGAYAQWEEPVLRDRAMHLSDFLWNEGYHPEKGMYHYYDGAWSLPSYLSDQVAMIMALLDGYEAIGDPVYRGRAVTLARWTQEHLGDPVGYGYWDLPSGRHGTSGSRLDLELQVPQIPAKPFMENAVAAMAMNRLALLTGDSAYREQAKQILEFLSREFRSYKHHAAPFGLAVDRYLTDPCQVVIVGKRGAPDWENLLRAAHRIQSPWKVIRPLDRDQDKDRLSALGYLTAGDGGATPPATAYVCVGKTCLAPVVTPEELASLRPHVSRGP